MQANRRLDRLDSARHSVGGSGRSVVSAPPASTPQTGGPGPATGEGRRLRSHGRGGRGFFWRCNRRGVLGEVLGLAIDDMQERALLFLGGAMLGLFTGPIVLWKVTDFVYRRWTGTRA
jgi:hypothetical protein